MSITAEKYMREIEDAFNWQATDFSVRRKIRSTRVLVASDAHLPYADRHLLSLMRLVINQVRIECVLWLGDFFDMHKFSRFGVTDHNITWQQEKNIASNILTMIAKDLEPFNGFQMISRGNHDHRWIKKLDEFENMEGLICSISPDVACLVRDGLIDVSDNPTLEGVPDASGNMTWLFTHPAQFKAPFQTPAKLAMMEQKNVVSAHAHHFGYTRDESGKYWAVEAGGLFKDTSLEYAQRNLTTMRRMVNGFWVIIDDMAPLGFTGSEKQYLFTNKGEAAYELHLN